MAKINIRQKMFLSFALNPVQLITGLTHQMGEKGEKNECSKNFDRRR